MRYNFTPPPQIQIAPYEINPDKFAPLLSIIYNNNSHNHLLGGQQKYPLHFRSVYLSFLFLTFFFLEIGIYFLIINIYAHQYDLYLCAFISALYIHILYIIHFLFQQTNKRILQLAK